LDDLARSGLQYPDEQELSLKILEAMDLGTPVVSTSKGAEGLAVTAEHDILIADRPEEFARQILRERGTCPQVATCKRP
jgi:glycosyltransferase involved in cell wall biosynthesis